MTQHVATQVKKLTFIDIGERDNSDHESDACMRDKMGISESCTT